MALTIKTNKCCYFCDNNLPVGAAIPVFTVTKNKEFTCNSCLTADGIVLAELLKSVGLHISLDGPPAACKKCAWKIFNCSTLFHELEIMLKVKTASNSQSVKRLHGNRSPSARIYTRSKEGELYSSRTARTRTKSTYESSGEILI